MARKQPEQKDKPLTSGDLVEVGAWTGVLGANGEAEVIVPSNRDLGIAYALAAEKCDKIAAVRAMELLREATKLAGAAADDELHAQLAFFEQVMGDKEVARREYLLALEADADDAFAAGNLALLKAGDRQYGEAVGLWARAFQNDPAELQAGMNLAIVECGVGKREAALGTLERILAFSPDYGKARTMVQAIRSGQNRCGRK
jgi:tetratricopeptide (TPR) repeat protein